MGKRIIILESERLDIERMYDLNPLEEPGDEIPKEFQDIADENILNPIENPGDEIPYEELPKELQKFVDEHNLNGKFYEAIFEDLKNYKIVKGFQYVSDGLTANFLLDWINIHKRKSKRISDCLGKRYPNLVGGYDWCRPTIIIQQIVNNG